jgi:Spy/CpxP family protein refolding chaperone
MLRIRALLTPEQRRELVEIHEERKQRREERFGAPRGARPSGAPRTPPDLAPP